MSYPIVPSPWGVGAAPAKSTRQELDERAGDGGGQTRGGVRKISDIQKCHPTTQNEQRTTTISENKVAPVRAQPRNPPPSDTRTTAISRTDRTAAAPKAAPTERDGSAPWGLSPVRSSRAEWDAWIDGWTDGRMDGRTDGRKNGQD